MLDFTELGQDGIDLEQLTRDLALSLGYSALWSGVGPDDGKDLLVDEPGDAVLGRKIRRWLVSAKHFSNAAGGTGRAVGVSDLGSIVDVVRQHGADGFLLVCTTHPSAAVVRRLDAIQENERIQTHIWDGATLERLLGSPHGWAIAQRYLPISTSASEWRVFATDRPNRYVGVFQGVYFHMINRIGSNIGLCLDYVEARIEHAKRIPMPDGHEIRLRGAFYDDKNGVISTHWDYLWQGPTGPVSSTSADMKALMGDGTVLFDDGQSDEVEVVVHEVNRTSAHYDVDHYRYYDQLPHYW